MDESFGINFSQFQAEFNKYLDNINQSDRKYLESINAAQTIFDGLNKTKAQDGGEERLDAQDGFNDLETIMAITRNRLVALKAKADPVYNYLLKEGHGSDAFLVKDPENEDKNITLTGLLMRGDTKAAVDNLIGIVNKYGETGENKDVIIRLAKALKVITPAKLVDRQGSSVGSGVAFNGKGYFYEDINEMIDKKDSSFLYEITRRLSSYAMTLQMGNTDFINPVRAGKAGDNVKNTFGLG